MPGWNHVILKDKRRMWIGDTLVDVHRWERRALDARGEPRWLERLQAYWAGRARPTHIARSFEPGTSIMHLGHTCFGMGEFSFPICPEEDHPFLVLAATITRIGRGRSAAKPFFTLVYFTTEPSIKALEEQTAAVAEAIPSMTKQMIGVTWGQGSRHAVYLHFDNVSDRVLGRLLLAQAEAVSFETVASE